MKDNYIDNAVLEAAYMLFIMADEEERYDDFIRFLNELSRRMSEDGMVPMPFVDMTNAWIEAINILDVKAGESFTVPEDVRLRMDTMTDSEGNQWLPLFINDKALSKGNTANIIMPVAIYDVIRIGLTRSDILGIVINPFDNPFTLNKEVIEMFLSDYEAWAKKSGFEVPGRNSMFYKGDGS